MTHPDNIIELTPDARSLEQQWRDRDPCRFEEWARDCNALSVEVETLLAKPSDTVRAPRRPTLTSVAKQATKAGIAVARYEVKPDGTVVVVTGKPEPAEADNPWLIDIDKATKQ
jgi:hypothetical protein